MCANLRAGVRVQDKPGACGGRGSVDRSADAADVDRSTNVGAGGTE